MVALGTKPPMQRPLAPFRLDHIKERGAEAMHKAHRRARGAGRGPGRPHSPGKDAGAPDSPLQSHAAGFPGRDAGGAVGG